MRKSISIFLIFLFINLFSYGQSSENKIKGTDYHFDLIKSELKMDLIPEALKIKSWILATIKNEKVDEYCTPRCAEYLIDIPDDITLGMEENPAKLKKEFYNKWSKDFDMLRITMLWADFGNGGCMKTFASNPVYLGQVNREFYFNVKFHCDDPKNGIYYIIKIIPYDHSYRIANIMSEEKRDWFEFNSY